MKKKILTFTIIAAVSIFLLAGCGNATVDADNNSVADSGTNSVAEKTDEVESTKTTSECVHQWKEATYAELKTCSLCGETEGEPKQSYFEEHGAQVADAPVVCSMDAVLFDYFDLRNQKAAKVVWEQIDCYREPADQEGYQLIHLDLGMSLQHYFDAGQYIEYGFAFFDNEIYDWYTGLAFPSKDLFLDDAFDYSATLEIDGVQYDVAYTKEATYEYGSWVYNKNGNGTKDCKGHIIYTFKVPDGYDGLVFAAVPAYEYTGQDAETVDESERYAFDEEAAEGMVFFRINKEGMVPERQQ